MKFPYKNLRPFITWRCNYKCEYCTVAHNPESSEKRFWPDNKLLRPGANWVKFLNSVTGHERVTFSGGEPTLHPDFVEIIDSLNHGNVWVYTNLSRLALGKISRLKKKITLYVSFHEKYADEWFWKRYEEVKELSHVVTGAPHQPADPSQEIDGKARSHRVVGWDSDGNFWHPQDPESRFDGKASKRVLCHTDNLPIAPDGTVYPCNEDAYREVSALGNVFEGYSFEGLPEWVECDHYGLCNPCEFNKYVEFLDE